MMQQNVPLLGQRRLRRDRLTAKRRAGLSKEPRFAERRPGNHHGVDVISSKRFDAVLAFGVVSRINT
jgi:hypothetical protein